MSTRRDFRAMTREAVQAIPGAALILGGSCCLPPLRAGRALAPGHSGVDCSHGTQKIAKICALNADTAGAYEKDLKS